MATKKLWCRSAGCNKFQVNGGYCQDHQYKIVEKDTRKSHAAHCPDAYDYAWGQVRNTYIGEHPLCEDCLLSGKTTPAREVHHIVPLEFGGARLEFSNLVALCSKCHHKRHKDLFAEKFLNQQIGYIKENKK